VTARASYVTGLAAVALIGAVLAWVLGPEMRDEVAFGVLIGLLVQAPLGWWTIRSIGTERFQLVWVAGMVIRLAVVAIAGLVLAPEYGWNTAALLAALVATLLILLLVEAVTAVREHSRTT
jgi:heme A synthase